ncbi:MAG TPA: hypothetical protein QGH10_06760 [Armatimonadota bacterium]|nr:hypothetical protein [Armatimonadota bacterium]
MGRSILKRALIGLLVLGVCYTGISIYASVRLNRELSPLKARGKAVTLPLPRGIQLADHENAAPLYAAAAGWAKMHRFPGGWDPAARPSGAGAWKYGYDDLDDQWPGDIEPEVLDCLEQLVALDEPALELIRDAACRPHCAFDHPWLPLMRVRHPMALHDVDHLIHFLVANSLVAARAGDQRRALECLRLGFVLGRHTAEEPMEIAQSRAITSATRVMVSTSAWVIPSLRIDEADARALADEISRLDMAQSYALTLDHSRSVGLFMFESVRHELRSSRVVTRDAPGLWRLYAGPLRPLMHLDEVAYLKRVGALEMLLAESPRERALRWRDVPSWSTELRKARWAPLTHEHRVPPRAVGVRRQDCADVSHDLLRVVLGLQVYWQQHGSFPMELDDLRASGWDVPKDRFSEEELIYRPESDTFTLYSVGPNLVDDGGRPGYWPYDGPYGDPIADKLESDIVWKWAEG